VGDAGHPKDPLHARGIRDAFRDVELLVDAADSGLSGRASFDASMAAYEEARNAAARPIYDRLRADVQFPTVSDAERRLLAAVAEDPTQADRFVGLRAGTVTRAEFEAGASADIRRLLEDVDRRR
jgi:2-polyprenyl-6-methoxyphenol hydroxylase-like FAD-dependent oxidoreductase